MKPRSDLANGSTSIWRGLGNGHSLRTGVESYARRNVYRVLLSYLPREPRIHLIPLSTCISGFGEKTFVNNLLYFHGCCDVSNGTVQKIRFELWKKRVKNLKFRRKKQAHSLSSSKFCRRTKSRLHFREEFESVISTNRILGMSYDSVINVCKNVKISRHTRKK